MEKHIHAIISLHTRVVGEKCEMKIFVRPYRFKFSMKLKMWARKKFVCAFPATFPSLFLLLNCAHHTRWSSIEKYFYFEEFPTQMEFWANKKWKFICIKNLFAWGQVCWLLASFGRPLRSWCLKKTFWKTYFKILFAFNSTSWVSN